MAKPSILIVTTDDDISIDLFFDKECKTFMEISAVPYSGGPQDMAGSCDFLYLRDPFNTPDYDEQEIKNTTKEVVSACSRSYKIDGVSDYKALTFEDKWKQYELLGPIMPPTRKLDSFKIKACREIVKKRISARSRGIYFDAGGVPPGTDPKDFIAQSRLQVMEEYRVFMIGGEIILPLGVKASKTPDSQVRIRGLKRAAPREVVDICHQIQIKTGFDFMGVDIAKTQDGYFLLEVNRSPQFYHYFQKTGKNLAQSLFAYLLEKNR